MKKKNKKRIHKVDAIADSLNEKQKMFCFLYIHDKECFGNATKTYQKAYGVTYAIAKASGTRLLSNVSIRGFINSELDRLFDTKEVDRELTRAMYQDKDISGKVSAIKEFNKLKQRITEKMDVTSLGDKIIGINYIKPDGNNIRTNA